MQCPFCRADEDRVVDSRSIGDGNAIRRRRKCLACSKRFTTYERTEVQPRVVIKKDSSRESFSREKILTGMIKACEKRNISLHDLENQAARIEAEIFEQHDSEVSTRVIGEKVGDALKEIDHVAYVRFASVYREFKDVNAFLEELIPLVRPRLDGAGMGGAGMGGSGSNGAGVNGSGMNGATLREPLLAEEPGAVARALGARGS